LQTELILRCDLHGKIRQVVSNTTDFDTASFLNNSIMHCLAVGSIDQGLHLLHDVQHFGRADNRYLDFLLDGTDTCFLFSGALLQNTIILVGTTHSGLTELPEIPLPETTKAQQYDQNLKLHQALLETQNLELLEEMSRLNNELINAKRELIRKNLELERLHRVK
jgi:hypothetical protein